MSFHLDQGPFPSPAGLAFPAPGIRPFGDLVRAEWIQLAPLGKATLRTEVASLTVEIPLEGRLLQVGPGLDYEAGAGEVVLARSDAGAEWPVRNPSARKSYAGCRLTLPSDGATLGGPRFSMRFLDWQKKEGVFYDLVCPEDTPTPAQEIAPLLLKGRSRVAGGRFAPGTKKTILLPSPSHALVFWAAQGAATVSGRDLARGSVMTVWGETSVSFEIAASGPVAEVLLLEIAFPGPAPF